MATARVMFVMSVSCVVTIDVPEGVDPNDAIDDAFQELPGFTDQHWEPGDASAFNDEGKPYLVEIG